MSKSSAIAHANIALVKYWGKRDTKLHLPQNSSISLTLSELKTITTVDPTAQENSLVLNNKEIATEEAAYKNIFDKFLPKINKITPIPNKLKIVSENNFPTAGGLASSASGFAALTEAICTALELKKTVHEKSIIARLGSGSATRSILGGFNYWRMGTAADGNDSHIEQIADQDHWSDLRLAVCITTNDKKATSSRAGMENVVQTSPIYQSAWLDSIEKDLKIMERAILEKDFTTLGQVAELNALKMHATMLASTPPLVYWNESTKALSQLVVELRQSNELECYFTIDAGPQVKILFQAKDQQRLEQILSSEKSIERYILCTAGGDAQTIEEHLF